LKKFRLSGEADMTEGVIWKQIVSFAFPMMLGLFFQQFYNTVDSIVVGQFVGKEALAAVGCTGSIVNMVVGLFTGIATGAGVIISQCYGSHDMTRLKLSVSTTTILTGIMCLIATPFGILIVDPMLNFMATPSDVYEQAHIYLTIYFAGLPGLLIYNMGSGILRAVGDSKRPLYFLIFSAIVNIVTDLTFVIVFNMGVAGVAYATILSQFLSAILVVIVLSKGNASYKIPWKDLHMDKTLLKEIFNVGMPSGIQQAITAFSNVFVQSYINFYGSACMAGWSAYGKLDIFIMIPMMSVSLALTTFVGQNYGASRMDRARKGVKISLIMGTSVTLFLTILMLIFQRPMIELFSQEDEVIYYGMQFITIISPFYFLTSSNQIFASALRGIGNAKTPMIVMLSSFVVFRQLYLFVNKLLGSSFISTALAYPAGWVVCGILMTIFYRRSVFCRYNKDAETSAADSVKDHDDTES
jgi:putative MATE family efflux protein